MLRVMDGILLQIVIKLILMAQFFLMAMLLYVLLYEILMVLLYIFPDTFPIGTISILHANAFALATTSDSMGYF